MGTQSYDAYGAPIEEANDMMWYVTEAGYTGHLMLKDMPFIYMNARLFSYELGTFTSTDPIFADMYMSGGLNAYGYAGGSPYRYWDPSGMAPDETMYLHPGALICPSCGVPTQDTDLSPSIGFSQPIPSVDLDLTQQANRILGDMSAATNASVIGVGLFTEKQINLKARGMYQHIDTGKVYKDGFRGNQIISSNSVYVSKLARDNFVAFSGTANKAIGAAGSILTPMAMYSDYLSLDSGLISENRFMYRSGINAASMGVGIFVPPLGAAIGVGGYGAEKVNDFWLIPLAEGMTKLERDLTNKGLYYASPWR